jgi:D-xylose 1-dehydrogenase (NADP+, D-xylono-1,5-lactone-forming)
MDGTMWLHSNRSKAIREKLSSGDLGDIVRVIASFTFKGPNDEWINGGNGRTDSTREPLGCFGDQGWYPLGAIMFSYNYELPVSV